MLRCLNKAALFGICLAAACATSKPAVAQDEIRPVFTRFSASTDSPGLPEHRPVDAKSLLLLIGAQIHETDLDCSHFVQNLYEQAGLYYGYAPSRTLYDGMDSFKRVLQPVAGDLIVWRGHVGIVVDPVETTFLSALRTGVKTSSYASNYWKKRGRPRFLRYIGFGEPVNAELAKRKSSSRANSDGY